MNCVCVIQRDGVKQKQFFQLSCLSKLTRMSFSPCLHSSVIFDCFARGGMAWLCFGVCLEQLLANNSLSGRFSSEERFTNPSLLYKYLHLYLKEEEEKAPHGGSQPPHPLSPAHFPPFLAFLFQKLKIVMCAGNEGL